ncbi:MAG: SRPBCC domain-containing protein, partial [Sneathiella sp.]
NIDAPNGYTITGEGKGGAAGFGKGGADIKLTDADGGTLLSYTATASVGGKMAQIGSRLIDSTAKKLAGEFFAKFNELVSEPSVDISETPMVEEVSVSAAPDAPASPAEETAGDVPQAEDGKPGWMRPVILIPAAIVVVVALYYLSKGA